MIAARQPWYREDPYTDSLGQEIRRAILTSEQDRRQSICDAALAQFAYERERWRYQSREVLNKAPTTSYTRYLLEDVDPALNQIKSLTDKFVADMLQATPGLAVQTSDGRYEDIVQDRTRSRLLQGLLDRTKFRDARRRWIRQGLLERVGWIYPSYRTGGLSATCLQQYQVYYDARGALDKDPLDMHLVERWDRRDLLRWYDQVSIKIPDKAGRSEKIADPNQFPPVYSPVPVDCAWVGAYRMSLLSEESGDRLRVVRSWRRSWQDGQPDGREVISVMGDDASQHLVLIDRPYSRTTFPLVWWTPWETSHGIDGISIPDSMIVTDLALAVMIRRVNQMMQRHGADKLIMPRKKDLAVAAQYKEAGFDVIWDSMLDTDDGKPEHFKAYVLQPSEMAYIDFLMTRPTGLLGVTEQAVQGTDPLAPGASGVARLQAKFQAIGRQLAPINAYTTAHKELGNQAMYAVDDGIATNKDFKTSYRDGHKLVTTPWVKYAVASERRRIVIAEVGTLGSDPAGQLQAIEQLVGTGQLPAEASAQMLADQPDIQRLVGGVFASREAIQRHLSVLSDPNASDEWLKAQPTEDMDLPLAIRLATQAINASIADDALSETTNRLRGYSIAAQATMASIEPTASEPTQGLTDR